MFAVGIALLFGLLAASSWWSKRDNPRAGSKIVQTSDVLDVTNVPETYRAVYRVENRAGAELNVTTEKMWVRRPFASRIRPGVGTNGCPRARARSGPSPTRAGDGRAAEHRGAAGGPSGDLRVDASRREHATKRSSCASGARCTAASARCTGPGARCSPATSRSTSRDGGPTPISASTATVWSSRSTGWTRTASSAAASQRRSAIDPPVTRSFRERRPESQDVPRGAVRRIDEEIPDSRIPLWTLPRTPKGFDHLGRYARGPVRPGLPTGLRCPVRAGRPASDVYHTGSRLLRGRPGPIPRHPASLEKRITRNVNLEPPAGRSSSSTPA